MSNNKNIKSKPFSNKKITIQEAIDKLGFNVFYIVPDIYTISEAFRNYGSNGMTNIIKMNVIPDYGNIDNVGYADSTQDYLALEYKEAIDTLHERVLQVLKNSLDHLKRNSRFEKFKDKSIRKDMLFFEKQINFFEEQSGINILKIMNSNEKLLKNIEMIDIPDCDFNKLRIHAVSLNSIINIENNGDIFNVEHYKINQVRFLTFLNEDMYVELRFYSDIDKKNIICSLFFNEETNSWDIELDNKNKNNESVFFTNKKEVQIYLDKVKSKIFDKKVVFDF